MMHGIFWLALVGWVAGWVTGRQMKHDGRGAWGDSFIGMIGGLACGYPLLALEHRSNWGLLVSCLVAATGASLLTWIACRVMHHGGHPVSK